MREDPECTFRLNIQLLHRIYSMVTPSVMIRVGLSHSRLGTARGLAKLLRTLHRLLCIRTYDSVYRGVPNFIGIEQPACVIYFRGQAGSATAEPALSPIL